MDMYSSIDANRIRLSLSSTLKGLSICLFVLLILSPLFFLLVSTTGYLADSPDGIFALLLISGRRLTLLGNTIGLAFAVAVSAMVIGILAATLLWRYNTGIISYLRWFVLILAPVPPYIHALAWSSTMQEVNGLLQGTFRIPFQGWLASWWVQSMSLLPLAVVLALIGLKSVEPLLNDAARVIRSDFQSYTRVVLQIALPMLLAGGGILFLLSVTDYSVPYLFQLNVYPLEIFAEFSASNEPAGAFLCALPLLLIAVVIVALSQYGLRNVAQGTTWHKPSWNVKPEWPRWFAGLQWVAIIIIVIQVLVPLINLAVSAATWQNIVRSVSSAATEINYTLLIAVIAAIVSLPLAIGVSSELFKRHKLGSLLWILVLLPVVLPPPLVGIGLISIWNSPMLIDVYGSTAMPIMAALVRFISFAVLILAVQYKYIDSLLIDAARIIQKNQFKIWLRIWIPMLLPGLIAAAGITFIMAVGELGATVLVVPPGQATLTLRIYNFLHYGASGTVAGLCLVMIIALLIAGSIVVGSLVWWSHITAKGQANS